MAYNETQPSTKGKTMNRFEECTTEDCEVYPRYTVDDEKHIHFIREEE